MRRLGILIAATAILGLIGCGGSSKNNSAVPTVFRATTDTGDPADGTGPETLRYRFVDVDTSSLVAGATRVALNLFDDTTYTAVRDSFSRDTDGTYLWQGHVEGQTDTNEIVLAVEDEALSGVVQVGSRYFEVAETEGPHIVTEHNNRYAPDHGLKVPVTTAPRAPRQTGTAADDGRTVDLMVLYTTAAKQAEDGKANTASGIRATIDKLVTQTNLALSNSGCTYQFRRVHSQEYTYSEAGLNMSAALNAIKADAAVATLRDRYAADVVMLLTAEVESTATGSTDGIANWLSDPTQPNSGVAFGVTSLVSAASGYTFAHETGHWFGCDDTPSTPPPLPSGDPYPDRYDVRKADWRGIMAYNGDGIGAVLGYWSNPAVSITVGGKVVPTGVLGTLHNVRCMNAAAYGVANYRKSGDATAAPD